MIINGAMIDVRKIKQHPLNPRKDLGDLTELIDSIRKQGILQNLTVVSDPEATEEFERFIAVIGHRRLAAAKSAGLSEVPCNIVEMTMQEQLVTMMSENMQRADLTPYEQAHGFQTMLDFGEDLESITVKTGFSESTVRRRLKLLELDQPKLKAAVDKGVSLVDLMRLEKIEDREERNKVLADIGTNNFEYNLERAVRLQENKKIMEQRLSEIKEWAREATDDEWFAATKYVNINIYQSSYKITEPKDAKEIQYFYRVEPNWIDIRKSTSKDDMLTSKEEARAFEADRRRREQLKTEWENCKNIRSNYFRNISKKVAKSLYQKIMMFMLLSSVHYDNRPNKKELAEFAGLEEGEITYEISEGDNIEQLLLWYVYLIGEPTSRPFNYNGFYEMRNDSNSAQQRFYRFLLIAGYEMSDVEKSLVDGTHSLYKEAKAEEGKQSDG